ncbi:MAG TPA: LLM class flavin-dependent oxidoreductase [Solirubrobacteraceae bacterium]
MHFHLIHIPLLRSSDDDATPVYELIAGEAAEAERLGFAGIWVAEHHAGRYGGVVPAAGVLLAYLAGVTTRLRLGSAVAVLPLRDPRATVEEFAMVDALSGGRLELGVGRGFMQHEFDALGIPFDERQPRFLAGLEALERGLGAGALDGDGDGPPVTPRPVQRPVPIWIAVSTSLESCRLAGERGYGLMLNPYNRKTEETHAAIETYLAGRAARGDGLPPRIMVNELLHVAESEEEAVAGARDALESYLRGVHEQFVLRPGLTALRATGFDDLYPDRLLVGTPEFVTGRLDAWRRLGVTDVCLLTHFGAPPPGQAARSRRLFAERVMPALERMPTDVVA